MSIKKIENFNIHEQPESNTDSFGVEAYLNANWEKTKEAVNNNAEELIQSQKDIDANKNDIENINSKNKSQDDTIEALKAENKLIKEQIPSANISENSIYIEDSSNLDFDWKIKGGHRQTTTDGRQLFDNTLKGYGHYGTTAKTIPTGVRLSVDTDVTASDYIFGCYAIINLSNFVGKTVRMKAMFKSNSNLKGSYTIGLCNSNGANRALKGSTGVSEKEISFVIPSLKTGQEYLGVWFYANSEGTGVAGDYVDYTNVIITINNEDMTYEPYTGGIPSLNPEYPQEIETVGSNVNLYNQENFLNANNWNKNTDGYYTGTANDLHTYITTQKNYITANFKKDTQYVINLKGYSNLAGGNFRFIFNYTDGTSSMNYILNTTTESDYTVISQQGKTVSYITTDYSSQRTLYIKDFKLSEGSSVTPYSPYGMGSVEIDISNENLFNEQYIQGYFVNDSGKTNTSTEGARADDYIPISDNKTIYVLFKCLKSCTLARFWLMEFDENYNTIKRTTTGIYDTSFNIGNTIKQLNLSQKCRYIKPSFYSLRDGDASLTYDKFNEYFNISISRNQTEEYIKHQSQTAIMPIQQEMLEGDYVADVEHHEWKKLTLTGDENIKLNTVFANVFNIEIPKINIMNQQVCLCNIAKGVVYNTALFTTQDNIIMTASPNKIVYKSTKFSSLSEFKTYLQNQYEEGTPVIVYYKLAEPINLELTEEQKVVRNQKLYTYKNITNIAISDELASIDVEYKKDLETEHNKLQNEIDEIKQLLSTTQTSALLLDNMQNDIESEVE